MPFIKTANKVQSLLCWTGNHSSRSKSEKIDVGHWQFICLVGRYSVRIIYCKNNSSFSPDFLWLCNHPLFYMDRKKVAASKCFRNSLLWFRCTITCMYRCYIRVLLLAFPCPNQVSNKSSLCSSSEYNRYLQRALEFGRFLGFCLIFQYYQ